VSEDGKLATIIYVPGIYIVALTVSQISHL